MPVPPSVLDRGVYPRQTGAMIKSDTPENNTANTESGDPFRDFHRTVPDGDDHERMVCRSCGFVHYENPKLVAGSVVTEGGRVLLCRRAIEPRKGFWTIPAGFMELHETPAEGAMREAWEEARARIRVHDLLAVYTVKRISQVQMMFRATLDDPGIAAGPESLEVAFFDWADIPWDSLAFPSVHWALTDFRAVEDKNAFAPFSNPKGWENA